MYQTGGARARRTSDHSKCTNLHSSGEKKGDDAASLNIVVTGRRLWGGGEGPPHPDLGGRVSTGGSLGLLAELKTQAGMEFDRQSF